MTIEEEKKILVDFLKWYRNLNGISAGYIKQEQPQWCVDYYFSQLKNKNEEIILNVASGTHLSFAAQMLAEFVLEQQKTAKIIFNGIIITLNFETARKKTLQQTAEDIYEGFRIGIEVMGHNLSDFVVQR